MLYAWIAAGENLNQCPPSLRLRMDIHSSLSARYPLPSVHILRRLPVGFVLAGRLHPCGHF